MAAIYVSGASGFVGHAVCAELVRRGVIDLFCGRRLVRLMEAM